MSSLILFLVLTVLLSYSLSVNGVNFGSISVSLQTSDNIFVVRSIRSLCLIDEKPLFLQLICFILNLLPQGQTIGKFAMLHPYCKRIPSQKCCFGSPKPNTLIISTVSQFDTSFSILISNDLLDFSDRLILN